MIKKILKADYKKSCIGRISPLFSIHFLSTFRTNCENPVDKKKFRVNKFVKACIEFFVRFEMKIYLMIGMIETSKNQVGAGKENTLGVIKIW